MIFSCRDVRAKEEERTREQERVQSLGHTGTFGTGKQQEDKGYSRHTYPVIPGHTRIFSGLCTADSKEPTKLGSSCGPLQIEFDAVGGSKSPRLTDKHNSLLAFCRPKSPSERAKLLDRKVMLKIVAREQSK